MTNWNTNYTYFITYSCYTRKMTVLLNGKETLSRNSAILQYMNEPFYRWCGVLPELLYRELGEDYRVVYTGRQEEAEILRNIFRQYPHCLALEIRDFELQKPLQERMIALSRLMKEKNLPRLPQRVISAAFTGKKKTLEKWKPLLQELDVKKPVLQRGGPYGGMDGALRARSGCSGVCLLRLGGGAGRSSGATE